MENLDKTRFLVRRLLYLVEISVHVSYASPRAPSKSTASASRLIDELSLRTRIFGGFSFSLKKT